MTGSRVALDTNLAILVLNGDPVISRWVLSFPEVLLPAVVLGELRFGAAKSAKPAENHARVDVLLAGCGLLAVRAATCDAYASVCSSLKQQGTPIPANDVWIARRILRGTRHPNRDARRSHGSHRRTDVRDPTVTRETSMFGHHHRGIG